MYRPRKCSKSQRYDFLYVKKRFFTRINTPKNTRHNYTSKLSKKYFEKDHVKRKDDLYAPRYLLHPD